MAEICKGGGYNPGSGKLLLAVKVSFRINKPGFRGLNGGIGDSFPSQKADIYDVISKNKTAIYLKFCNFHSFMPIIGCTKFGINQIILTVLSGVRAKRHPPP